MKPAPTRSPPASAARRFRPQIEQAISEGVTPDELALHLTLGDVEQLKRDREVAVADISFADGTMTYLGVKVVKGNVTSSVLRREAADTA